MRNRLLAGLGAVAAVISTVGFTAPRQTAAGEAELVNFQHVYNFQTTGTDPTGHGTDVEFYTTSVPKRDYATGQLLAADGTPLPAGAPPVMVTRDFAVLGTYLGGAFIFDITDVPSVQFVKRIPCNQTQNDVQLKQFGARWVLALAKDGSGNPCASPQKGVSGAAGIAVFDVTDPYAYKSMYSFRTTDGAHNFTFHPTKPYGWVSTGDLPGGLDHIPIIDFTNVDAPVLAADIQTQGGPHDITFLPNGNRAYVANENNYRIYDSTDPKAPVLISVGPNAGTYSHNFEPTPDGRYVMNMNESLVLGGFFAPGVCPGEGVTIFSIEGPREMAPVPVGQYFANIQGPAPNGTACTAHVGKATNTTLVLGWYGGGTRVVDISNPSLPREVGSASMSNTEAWASKFYKGPYVYVGDMLRGFDVFKWTGAGPAPWTV